VTRAFTDDWISSWRRRAWRKVKNVDLWQALIAEVDRHRLSWQHVAGHTGVELNERCDELAGAARTALSAANR
jgi:ribonuclease HI